MQHGALARCDRCKASRPSSPRPPRASSNGAAASVTQGSNSRGAATATAEGNGKGATGAEAVGGGPTSASLPACSRYFSMSVVMFSERGPKIACRLGSLTTPVAATATACSRAWSTLAGSTNDTQNFVMQASSFVMLLRPRKASTSSCALSKVRGQRPGWALGGRVAPLSGDDRDVWFLDNVPIASGWSAHRSSAAWVDTPVAASSVKWALPPVPSVRARPAEAKPRWMSCRLSTPVSVPHPQRNRNKNLRTMAQALRASSLRRSTGAYPELLPR